MKIQTVISVMLASAALPASAQPRPVDRILPALGASKACASVIQLQNLGERPAALAVEAYTEDGALVALKGHPAIAVDLAPRQRESYRLELPGETSGAWVRVREMPSAEPFSSVVTVSGSTECVVGDQLRSVARQVAFPLRDPWYEGDVAELPGDLLAMVNSSAQPATAFLCYSGAAFYSVPGGRPNGQLTPVCTSSSAVQVPPFSARQFPVAREGSSHFAMHTRGTAVALQMLKPQGGDVKVYVVDSSIHFGSEVVDR